MAFDAQVSDVAHVSFVFQAMVNNILVSNRKDKFESINYKTSTSMGFI